ncbi:GNAT family N-acetyltransferase [Spongiactinospora sp. 9N601]|uniref:GNAT family N-acetyltransferase n=1 Tax=Spongiactinospora sp. 9N601 TaxID=3375149 RepID=UPI00378EA00A
MTNLDHFALRPRNYDHPHAARLVRALFDDQTQRYGYADPFEADPAGYTPPQGLFLVGYLDQTPVACGGYRTYDARTRTVEIKKMYTLPELRGHGLGERVITELGTACARVRGAAIHFGDRRTQHRRPGSVRRGWL